MKLKNRTPKGGVEKETLANDATLGENRITGRIDVHGSPFQHAANESANRRTIPSNKRTPFNAAMENAAKHDKLRSALMRSERERTGRNVMHDSRAAPKQDRLTKAEAKKSKSLAR